MNFARVLFAFVLGASAAELPPMPREFLADPAAVVAAARAATTARFPDADLVMVDDRLHTRYEADGTNVFWDDEWVKVMTEKGRRARLSLALDVSLRYEDAAIELVEIIGTNGVARTVDFKKTLKMATDNSSVSANIYDPLDKRLVCAVPGLEVGEIRHVRYCRRTHKARMKGAWADRQLLEYTAPLLRTVVTVDQPAALPVCHAVVRHPFGRTVTRAPDRPLGGGRTLLTWEARDVPQAFSEPSMPAMAGEVQALRLSTLPDWPTVSRWYYDLCRPHLAAGTPGLTNKVAALVRGLADDTAKVRALYKFVSQQIRYMGITTETEAPGYEPHDVGLTFENRYGVCRDKAALLAEMLSLAGFTARPVLIHAGAKMDAEIPSPYFNHAITAVKLNGQWRLMDSTDENSRDLLPSYLSDCSYLVADPAGEPLRLSPVRPVSENMFTVSSDGTLSPDGSALVTTHFAFGGINDTVLRHHFMKRTDEKRRQTVEGLLRRTAPGAELLSCTFTPTDLSDTETPLSLKTIARFPEVVMRGTTRDEVSPPLVTANFSVAAALLSDNTALQKRRFPLELASTAGAEETLTLHLNGVVGEPLVVPNDVTAGEGSPYTYSYRAAVSNDTLSIVRRQLVTGIRFDVPAYYKLKEDLQLVEGSSRAQPTFRARTDDNADVHYRLSRRELFFSSPTAWVETNTVEKQVLTYQGKKSSAELKFGYNPLVRDVTLVSATVSNRDGRVYAVTDKERHVLDCGWAASAPRYPAGKTLVVNLPGVEVGSVIRYVTARRVVRAPLAFSTFTTFDSTQPIDRMTLKLTLPDGLPFRFRATGFDRPGAIQLTERTNGVVRYAWSVKNPERLPNEPSQAPASSWRTTLFATMAEWAPYAAEITHALEAARDGAHAEADKLARRLTAAAETPEAAIQAVRAFMAGSVRTSGPGLFELPFDAAFFPPDRTLADGYGSAADRRNLTFALLEAAGFDCSFVFAADDSSGLKEYTRLYQEKLPRPDYFDALVIRAVKEGRVFYLAGENEYTPPGCSVREGDTYFDPATCTFSEARLDETTGGTWCNPLSWFETATAAQPGTSIWSPRDVNYCRMTVREDASCDFDVTNRTYGAGVGPFRKRFKEMLPEKRSRFYQTVLGNLAESASATRELVTETDAYPAYTAFSAFVPEWGSASGGEITIRVPDFKDGFISLGGPVRKSPIQVGGATETTDVYDIVFPKGFTQIEHLPESYVLRSPLTGEVWIDFKVTSAVKERRLMVRLVRTVHRRRAAVLGADYFPFFRDWNRRISSTAGRTLVVRRAR